MIRLLLSAAICKLGILITLSLLVFTSAKDWASASPCIMLKNIFQSFTVLNLQFLGTAFRYFSYSSILSKGIVSTVAISYPSSDIVKVSGSTFTAVILSSIGFRFMSKAKDTYLGLSYT